MTARQAPEHLVPEVRIGEEDANGVYSGLRADPQAWWAFLRTLVHFDPNYPYNPEYEYGPTWTDDPRYVADSVRRLMGTQYWVTVCSFWLTLKRVWGSRIQIERRILIPQGIRDELSTDSPYRVEMEGVVPDGVVTAHSLPEDQRSLTVRRHDPEHPDQLYLEVVSRTERDVQRDIRHKLEVYEALGIREYLLYDLFRRLGDRPRLYLYRLGGEGNPTYAKVVPVRWADGHPAYHSEVLDRKIRMLPANDRGGALDPVDTDESSIPVVGTGSRCLVGSGSRSTAESGCKPCRWPCPRPNRRSAQSAGGYAGSTGRIGGGGSGHLGTELAPDRQDPPHRADRGSGPWSTILA